MEKNDLKTLKIRVQKLVKDAENLKEYENSK